MHPYFRFEKSKPQFCGIQADDNNKNIKFHNIKFSQNGNGSGVLKNGSEAKNGSH